MSFYSTQDYPNRKDWRKPGKAFHDCMCHGGCPYCLRNRMYQQKKELERCAVSDEPESIDLSGLSGLSEVELLELLRLFLIRWDNE